MNDQPDQPIDAVQDEPPAPGAPADDAAPASTPDANADDVREGEERDPLLERAERIADLPLGERPAAFDGLNRAVVAELQSLEEA